jgi:hypothetical protein
VAQLTGKRFLGNYTSDQQQYQALMDSGLTFAQTYNLRPGIALTAEQMAVLTTDIVWLQQETVTLPDGTQTVALVPHVYAAVRAGDLNAQGGLLSGNTVSINSTGGTGEVRNGGTILGRTVLEINANTINNLGGQIAANDVKLAANQDINVVGGSVTGQNSLSALAGNDINVVSTTASTAGGSGNYTYSRTGLDRMAGLYVAGPGTLLASAGNDLNIIGATVQGAGDTQLSAGNTVNLGTLQASQSNNFGAGDAKNHLLTSQTSDVGSTVEAGKDLTITAGQNVIAKAADLKAQGDVNIAAQGTVLLNAGQTRSSFDSVMTTSSSDLISTTTTRTQTQASAATAQVSSVQGQNVNITAGKDLISVGTQFKGTDSLRVEGKDTSTFYAATDVHQITTTTHTKTDLGAAFSAMLDPLGFGTPIEEKTVTDARATSTSIGTALLSDKKIEIGVGNKTELQGAKVEAQQIAFVKTDPTKAGELILGGSIDTTQTSHTEKTVTMGLYQEMKGKGSTTETLNQTQLQGNVSFDNALKITVQIPDTKGGQELKTAINALVAQGSGVGLDYLNALANNPNVDWEKVALAHDQWSYDQAGLTGAGAALLTIVVTYFTAGIGTTAVGGVAASAGSAATVMGSTALATAVNVGFSSLASQAAVAMVNNKGDLGKTLEQLGSEQSVQNLLTSMITAGALDKLNASYFKGVDASSTFGTQLLKNVTNNVASDLMNSALTGKPFDEKAFANALQGALVTTGMAQGANTIGAATLDTFASSVAHAALGCVGGAAIAGNGSGCTQGAVGAVVGELAAQYALDHGYSDSQTLALATALAATSGVLVGGPDGATAGNIASITGANAAANNALMDKSQKQKLAQLLKENELRPSGQQALVDAACSLMRCADGIDPKSPGYAALQKSQDRGDDNSDSSIEKAKGLLELAGFGSRTAQQAVADKALDFGNFVLDQLGGISSGALNLLTATVSNGPPKNGPYDMPDLDNGQSGNTPPTAGAVITPACITPPLCFPVPTPVLSPGTSGLTIVTMGNAGDGGDSSPSGASGGANGSAGADNTINQAGLNSQLLANEVASGHAFQKHVIERQEFADLGINTKSQFQSFVEKIVSNPAIERRQAVDGTVYYLDSSTKTIVIRGQRGEATAFRPDKGGVGWENYIKLQVPKK